MERLGPERAVHFTPFIRTGKGLETRRRHRAKLKLERRIAFEAGLR